MRVKTKRKAEKRLEVKGRIQSARRKGTKGRQVRRGRSTGRRSGTRGRGGEAKGGEEDQEAEGVIS